ncbi:PIN domain-containing protein [Subtercola frigoramans]|uniref:PIN domain-containing protein n=1 Tax=Subtercola frigoramans TaxID=120298 RepID=UPI001960CC3E
MILVDTSIWIDHLHRPQEQLLHLLRRTAVVQHPMIVGELALGTIRNRDTFLGLLRNLPLSACAEHDEVLDFVERFSLHGKGLSLVDVHLLASVALTPGASLWTRDKRLNRAAEELRVDFRE